MSPIIFLIYIGGVFNKVSETSPLVTSLSCANDGLIASGSSVKEIITALEKVAKQVIEWGRVGKAKCSNLRYVKNRSRAFFQISSVAAQQGSKNQSWHRKYPI